MYVAVVPNRNSPPAILLREGYREGGKAKTRTLANITDWKPERIEALTRVLKGEFDGLVGGDVDPISDRIYGVLFILNELADRVGVTKVLGTTRMGKLALFLVLARIADQGSRLSAVRWAEDHCIAEVLGLDEFDEEDLDRAMDWLAARHDTIEKKLYRAYAEKNGSPNILVLYDVTSSYREGQCNELAEYGLDRDKKKGKKQIVIGLLIGSDGEPLSVQVFKGNSSDPTTIGAQIDTLKRRFGVEEGVFVGDRGMVKSKGKEALAAWRLKYITALTNAQVRKLLREKVIQWDLFDTAVCEVEHEGRRLILRRSDAVRRKEAKRREDKVDRLKELVAQRNTFVSASRRADPETGLRNLTNWASRYTVSSFVELSLDNGSIVMTVDEQAKSCAAMLDGCYVLETDVSARQMDGKTVDQRYRSLQQVERDFRALKNGFLEVRPVFVRKLTRTAAPVFIAMLALKIIRAADALLKQAFCSDPGSSDGFHLKDALRIMSRLCLNRYSIKDIEVLRLPRLDDRQMAVCAALEIPTPSNRSSARLSAVAKSI